MPRCLLKNGRFKGTLNDLEMARRSIATRVRIYECFICSKEFSQFISLKSHMKTHTDLEIAPARRSSIDHPMTYVCFMCAEEFPEFQHLEYHMKIHNGERPHFILPVLAKRAKLPKRKLTRSKRSKELLRIVRNPPEVILMRLHQSTDDDESEMNIVLPDDDSSEPNNLPNSDNNDDMFMDVGDGDVSKRYFNKIIERRIFQISAFAFDFQPIGTKEETFDEHSETDRHGKRQKNRDG